jgi:N-acetylated-alpha-linked acidic dipeptidase
VCDVWRARSHVKAGEEPRMGDPGGGSDFAGFYNHLGIPIGEWGFGGGGGVYHSFYDSYHWMVTFGDPTFRYHAAAASIGAAMVLRFANADILPYDYVEYAQTMQRYLPALDSAFAEHKWNVSSAPLRSAIGRMEKEAEQFARSRDAVLAHGSPSRQVLERTNAALLRVERSLTRPEGLHGRSWFRNLIYVADANNGYANMVFPSINEAIRAGDRELAAQELADLATRFDAAAKAITDARHGLIAAHPSRGAMH